MKNLLKLFLKFHNPRGRGSCVRAWLILSNTSSLLWGMVQTNTKRQFWWCAYWFLLQKQLILQLSSAIVGFYSFMMGLLIWQEVKCTVSDTQVTGKTYGRALVYFPYWTSRIHQEYITIFQDKLKFKEITGRERINQKFYDVKV